MKSRVSWRLLWPASGQSHGPAGPREGSGLNWYTGGTGCGIILFFLLVLPPHGWGWNRGLSRLPGRKSQCLPIGGWSWVLALWWARPCLGALLEEAVYLRSLYAAFLLMGASMLVIWPEASQHWHLQALGWDQVLALMSQDVSHQKSSCGWTFLNVSATSVYVPRVSRGSPCLARRLSQDQQVDLSQALIKSLLLPWVLVCMRSCVHPPRMESLFFPVFWSSCCQVLLAFKTKCSGGLSSWCQTPRLGSLTWGSELSVLWENLWYSCSLVCGSSTQGVLDLIVSWVCPSYLSSCGSFFMSLAVEDVFL